VVEVLVAGAGPAGSVAALVLARAGVRVLLLDRARFPRDKLCGDTLNPGAVAILDRLGLGPRLEQRGLRIDGMTVTGEHGVQVSADYGPGVHGRAVVRRDLDAWLLSEAIGAGARFEERAHVLEPLTYHGAAGLEVRGVIVRARDGRRLRIPALVTIAADGRRSTLAFELGLAHHPRRPRRWAAGGYFEGVDGLSSRGEMHVRRRYYLGIAPLPGGLANVFLVTADRRGFDQPAALLKSTVEGDARLTDRFARARLVSPVVSMGPLAVEARTAGAPGLLLAGDAAGFIDPMTGDGVRLAVQGAELAARIVLQGLDKGSTTAHLRLAAARRATLERKLRFNRALRAIVGNPSAVFAGGILAAIAPGVLRRIIVAAGDVA
jgi:flavin-dependent dehydrogenase